MTNSWLDVHRAQIEIQPCVRVRRIVSEQLGVDYDRVYPEQRFVEDLGCD